MKSRGDSLAFAAFGLRALGAWHLSKLALQPLPPPLLRREAGGALPLLAARAPVPVRLQQHVGVAAARQGPPPAEPTAGAEAAETPLTGASRLGMKPLAGLSDGVLYVAFEAVLAHLLLAHGALRHLVLVAVVAVQVVTRGAPPRPRQGQASQRLVAHGRPVRWPGAPHRVPCLVDDKFMIGCEALGRGAVRAVGDGRPAA